MECYGVLWSVLIVMECCGVLWSFVECGGVLLYVVVLGSIME